MKVTSILSIVTAIVLGVSMPTHAALQNRGTDTLGNRLIYDSDLNITWYDYTNSTSSSWDYHMNWASALTVNIGGTVYDDWRLPTITIMETPAVHSYGGLTTFGYNITSSEMGHLFHTELGNLGRYDTSGNDRGAGNRLVNTDPFMHLQPHYYYSNTGNPNDFWTAVYFNYYSGEQYVAAKLALGGTGLYSMAVRQGNVVPEPASFAMLLGIGGMLWAGRRFSSLA